MASDIMIEIFAYKWFNRIVLNNETLPQEYDVTEVYKDECLAYPEFTEAFNCDDLYWAIVIRRWLFEKLYLEEIQTQVNEFKNSQTDFYCYVLRTCNRVDLFGSLSIFEQVFATCAFVCFLCFYCKVKFPAIMRCGYICWGMYFDEFIDEFYKQGGWTRLKFVAASYRRPLEFIVTIANIEGEIDITLIKIRKAVRSYCRFKIIGEIDSDESISMSWIKFYTQYINRSSENDLNQLTEESPPNELKRYSEVEDFLKHLKYLCDPDGSEVIFALRRLSPIDSLETSKTNLNIYIKRMNLQSEANTILEPKFEQTTTKNLNIEEENVLASRKPDKSVSATLDISPEQNSLVQIERISEVDPVKTECFQLESQEQGVKTTLVENLFESKCKRRKGLKKNTILAAQLPSTEKNTKKLHNKDIRCEAKMEQNGWKIKKGTNKTPPLSAHMLIRKNNHKKNSSKIENGTIEEQDEWEFIKYTNRSMSLIGQVSLTKKNGETENNYKMPNGAKKEQEEQKDTKKISISTDTMNVESKNDKMKCDTRQKNKGKKKEKKRKKKNSILMREMLNEGKNNKEEKEIKNSIWEEQDDGIKNFLRMFLVLGDKQGINYVRKTSEFCNIESNS